MPSISRGLNGAPAGRFLDVSGWVGALPTTLTHIHHRSAWPRFLEVDECHAPRERCAHCASRGLMALTLMP